MALGAALLGAFWVLSSHSGGAGLLQDTDTHVLLQTIRARNAPFSWFLSDWPLYNHFYRPIPTLTFELDLRLWGGNAAGYGWTNAVLAAGCVLSLFWFLREFVDRPLGAALGTLLFAYWHTAGSVPFDSWLFTLAGLTLVAGAIRHRTDWRSYVPASLVLLILAHEVSPISSFGSRIVHWLPGRTAECMGLFALLSMAAYARFERLGPNMRPVEIDPLTPPATRSSRQQTIARARWPWAALAVLFAALSFASYEQAVMLPACLLAIALVYHWRGFRPGWQWQAAFWALLVGYLALRHQVVPSGVSGYQKQQLRTTASAISSLYDFIYPFGTWQGTLNLLQQGWFVFFGENLYLTCLSWVAGVTTVWELRREWVLAVAGLGMSVLAFLPMAWLKMFEHYYYWPEALRTVLVIAIGSVAWRLLSTAWCPPALQAPQRLAPAPGSLPRP